MKLAKHRVSMYRAFGQIKLKWSGVVTKSGPRVLPDDGDGFGLEAHWALVPAQEYHNEFRRALWWKPLNHAMESIENIPSRSRTRSFKWLPHAAQLGPFSLHNGSPHAVSLQRQSAALGASLGAFSVHWSLAEGSQLNQDGQKSPAWAWHATTKVRR